MPHDTIVRQPWAFCLSNSKKMVKETKKILIVLASVIFFHFARAQTTDSINCNEYFNWLEEIQLITLWSRPPLLKETNMPILCELRDMTINEPYKIVATLVLNKNGNPQCVRIHPETVQDSLKNKIIKLLYMIELEPAIGSKNPVISHYILLLNTQRCEMYRNKNAQKKSWRKKIK